MEDKKINIAVAWSDILKIRDRIKLITLLGIVYCIITFLDGTLFAGLGLKLMFTGLGIMLFGIFYALNEKESQILRDKISGKIKSTFGGQ